MKKLVLTSVFGLLACIGLVPSAASAAATSKMGTSTESLIGWWTFDEATGTIAHDFSATRSTGTLTNSPTWTSGKRGGALQFNGSSSFVDTTIGIDAEPVSVAAWAYPTSFASNHCIWCTDNGGWDKGLEITSGRWQVHTGSTLADTGVSATLNAWQHTLLVYSATNIQLYINGQLVWSNGGAPGADAGSAINIGRAFYNAGAGSRFFQGKIDDVRVYNRALTASDAIALYKTGEAVRRNVSNNGLVGYWSFNEGTSTTAHDFSGQGNNASMSQSWLSWGSGPHNGALNMNGGGPVVYGSTNTGSVFGAASIPAFQFGINSFTLAGWIRMDTQTNGCCQSSVFSSWGSVRVGLSLSGGTNTPSPHYILKDASGNQVGTPATQTVTLGKWNHLALVVNRATNRATLYLNGQPTSQSNVDISAIGSLSLDNIAISGGSFGGAASAFLNGAVDEVRVYSRALSSSEVATLYDLNSAKMQASQSNKASSGLVGYWSFNGKDINWATNTAYDASGSGNNGAMTSFTAASSAVAGKLGQALSFNGTTQSVTAPAISSIAGTNPRSLSFWIKTSLDINQPIWDSGNINTVTQAYEVYQSSSGLSGTGAPTGSQMKGIYVGFWGDDVMVPYTIADGKWHHVAISESGTTVYVQIDGTYPSGYTMLTSAPTWSGLVSQPFTINAAPNSTNNPVLIGQARTTEWGTGNLRFTGAIDEVRAYNRALSVAEMKQLYLMNK